MLFVIFFPALCALLMPLVKAEKGKKVLLVCALALEAAAVCVLLPSKGAELTLFSMTPALTAHLRMDDISRLFMTVAAFGFLFAGVYALRYMSHSERRGSFPRGDLFTAVRAHTLRGKTSAAFLLALYRLFLHKTALRRLSAVRAHILDLAFRIGDQAEGTNKF